jgi:ankyrin repeat protein
MEDDPGRQSISGSFSPIDVGEWSGQAYIGPTEKFFTAIVAGDRVAFTKIILEGINVNRRDHVGRTPLQIAILVKQVDLACDLIDAGARITARMVDGRTALHLAAQLDLAVVLRKLLERNAINKEQVANVESGKGQKGSGRVKDEKEDDAMSESYDDEDGMDVDSERPSSEDDWSSEESEWPVKKTPAPPKEFGAGPNQNVDMPEDEDNVPDILDVNATDWDHAFTPLSYAILYGSLPLIEELLMAGADVKLVTQAGYTTPTFHPLTLTILTEDEDRACRIAERLLLAGAVSSAADDDMRTIFYRVVCSKRTKLASTILRCDPNIGAVINFPSLLYSSVDFPLVAAIAGGNYSMLALLLAHGAKVKYTEDDISRAKSVA